MKKHRKLWSVVLVVVLLVSLSTNALATDAASDDDIMLLDDWGVTVFVRSQTANVSKFLEQKATAKENRFTILFSGTEGPTAVRVYAYEMVSSGSYTKIAETTLYLNQSFTVNVETGNSIFATVMYVAGDSGNVTFHITAFA